jgi:outer membrane protein
VPPTARGVIKELSRSDKGYSMSLNICLGVTLAFVQSVSQVLKPMTIEEASEIAARNAFSVRTQLSLVEQSRQRLAESRALSGVQVSASGTYTRYSRSQQGFGGAGGALSDTRSAVISAQLPIDISGYYRNNIRSSKASYGASQNSLRVEILEAKLRAREAFVAVLRAGASVNVAEKSVGDAQAQLEQSEKLYREQAIALVDLARYRAQLTRFKSELVQRQNERQVAEHTFNRELALPIEHPVVLAEVGNLPESSTNADELIKRVLTQRPELLALQETAKAQGYSIQATSAGLRPSLAVSLDYQPKVGNAAFGGAVNAGTASLTLSIPLFDSGITRARVAAARQEQQQTQIALEQALLTITQEIRDALTNQSSAQTRFQNAVEQQKYAEEVYRISLVRQEAGQGTYVDVVDAATLLAQARLDVVNAHYDHVVAALKLQRAVGESAATKGEKE